MARRLVDNINSAYVEAANKLTSKKAPHKIVVYVESYDDIFFWRSVLTPYENEKRYFEILLPSKGQQLERGKKAAISNIVESVGPNMIACVDADYDYLLQGATEQSKNVLRNDYVFHTYAYAIENFQCYAPSLHETCVGITLNDHQIFDFVSFFRQYSEICFPLLVWSVWAYRSGNHGDFSLSDFNRVIDLGGFTLSDPQRSLDNVRRKVNTKIRELQRRFPNNKEAFLSLKNEMKSLGVQPGDAYLYIQGHHLFDTIVAPMLTKVCNYLIQEREDEISNSDANNTQKRNEMSCYTNSTQDVKIMLKKSTGYVHSPQFARIQKDIRKFLSAE